MFQLETNVKVVYVYKVDGCSDDLPTETPKIDFQNQKANDSTGLIAINDKVTCFACTI